jgi:hypothetical protein
MFDYVNFNVKYYILSQIFYKKIGWLPDNLKAYTKTANVNSLLKTYK